MTHDSVLENTSLAMFVLNRFSFLMLTIDVTELIQVFEHLFKCPRRRLLYIAQTLSLQSFSIGLYSQGCCRCLSAPSYYLVTLGIRMRGWLHIKNSKSRRRKQGRKGEG